jgi:hypothetical protein
MAELPNAASNTLIEAMRILGRSHADFGRDLRGELRFQEALQLVLQNDLGLESDREQPFSSTRFPNKKEIKPDHVVVLGHRKTAIELKYVYCRGRRRPANSQGFPYDVIKDCAKVEALIEDTEGAAATIEDGIVIGLTDFDFWSPIERDWWSKNYVLQDLPDWRRLGTPRLIETASTKRRSCIHPGITFNGRFHVYLSHDWEYRWLDYNETFRFIMLRRSARRSERDASIRNDTRNTMDFRLTTVPFRDAQHREDALNRKALFDSFYLKNGRHCPICKPGPGIDYRPFQE